MVCILPPALQTIKERNSIQAQVYLDSILVLQVYTSTHNPMICSFLSVEAKQRPIVMMMLPLQKGPRITNPA